MMIKTLYTTVASLLVVVVLSGLSADAYGSGAVSDEVRLEKHGKALSRRSVARKKRVSKLYHNVVASSGSSSRSSSSSYRSSSRRTAGVKMRSRGILKVTVSHGRGVERKVAGAFGQEKGRLPWPVDSGKVSMHFGLQSYMDNVKIDNLGIVIEAGKDAHVKAVIDGVVDDVMDIGEGVAVLVRHGSYFFIYSDLGKATVTRGQQICAGDVLGTVGETGQLDFRLYDAGDVWLDPEKWLAR